MESNFPLKSLWLFFNLFLQYFFHIRIFSIIGNMKFFRSLDFIDLQLEKGCKPLSTGRETINFRYIVNIANERNFLGYFPNCISLFNCYFG